MRSRALFAASFAFALASGVLGIGGCGDDDPKTPAAASGGASGTGGSGAGASAGSVGEPDISGVVYVAGATDEALESVVGVQATVDDAKAPLVSQPAANGEALTQLTAPTFAWSAALAKNEVSPLRRVLSFATLREAQAHGDPNTGLVYYAEFSDDKGAPLLRVFTTKTTYTPDATDWAKLVVAGGAISLRVTGARVENNDLVAGGGPFVASAPRTFSIAP